jgi:apoptosis-inducing factor 2
VWAIGDVGNLDFKAITVIEPQVLILAANLDTVLRGKSTLKKYQPASNLLLFVALGKTDGAGQMGGWKVFKFIVSMIKGKKLFLDKADGYVAGKHLFMSKV